MKVKCIKCGRKGTLGIKKTVSKGNVYRYYYLQHYDPESKKRTWCYLGKYSSLPDSYKVIIHKKGSLYTNYTQKRKNSKIVTVSQKEIINSSEIMVPRVRFEPATDGDISHKLPFFF